MKFQNIDFNLFVTNIPVLYPLKTQEDQEVFDVFRRV